jgi:hypothetical protein
MVRADARGARNDTLKEARVRELAATNHLSVVGAVGAALPSCYGLSGTLVCRRWPLLSQVGRLGTGLGLGWPRTLLRTLGAGGSSRTEPVASGPPLGTVTAPHGWPAIGRLSARGCRVGAHVAGHRRPVAPATGASARAGVGGAAGRGCGAAGAGRRSGRRTGRGR